MSEKDQILLIYDLPQGNAWMPLPLVPVCLCYQESHARKPCQFHINPSLILHTNLIRQSFYAIPEIWKSTTCQSTIIASHPNIWCIFWIAKVKLILISQNIHLMLHYRLLRKTRTHFTTYNITCKDMAWLQLARYSKSFAILKNIFFLCMDVNEIFTHIYRMLQ